ncbi:MAG: stage III sporulation protein AB [Oscillospiraceae bacterium]|nr:stage III sporulation protein AB [Oscillospiraceae bacterium]
MLNMLGAVLVIGGAAVIGMAAARTLTVRLRTLRAFFAALDLMERELSFRLTPTPELLDELAARMSGQVSAFFTYCRAGLERLGERSLGQVWREGLQQTELGLQEEDIRLLEELGDVLGRYDGGGQQAALARVGGQLAQCINEAQTARAKQGKMYGMLCLSAGLLTVIMLL